MKGKRRSTKSFGPFVGLSYCQLDAIPSSVSQLPDLGALRSGFGLATFEVNKKRGDVRGADATDSARLAN